MLKSDSAAPAGEQSSVKEMYATIPTARRGEELRIGRTMFKGKDYVMLRVWYPGNGDDEMLPGKGINVPIAMLPAIASAINQAHEAAKSEGLV